ncbi:exosortase-associated protein EpsI, B-type [Roseateles sp. NT4]|uniref:exosortase-associated protein EpsI, B-type n=1 Tax=Roseateles sp. NT4 TaxID=3453715 RepID=UPI003EE910FD
MGLQTPKSRLTVAIIATVLMLGSAVASKALAPTQRMAARYAGVSLETLIPREFSGWRIDDSIIPLAPDPTTTAELASLYSQTLSRTYVNASGQRVMLALAYGGDQSRELQVHRPEVCYAAQGFQVKDAAKVTLQSAFGTVPAMQLVARRSGRVEPITYWVRMGDELVRGNLEQGIARVRYGLGGSIPDGLLVRVSTLGDDTGAQYELQQSFVQAMLSAVKPDARPYLLGRPAGAAS